MKKIFIIAAAACVTLASCVKNEPVQTPELGESNIEIAFDAPVLAPNVKAGGAAVIPATYNDDLPFGVWAYHLAEDWATSIKGGTMSEDVVTYMNEIEISRLAKGTDPETYEWKNASKKYYWPKEGMLHFFAYSPYSVANYASCNVEGINFTNYVVSDADDNQVDLLYATPACGLTGGVVNVAFNHALSAINILVNKSTDAEIVLNSITAYGVKDMGNFTQGISAVQDESDEDTYVLSSTPAWNSQDFSDNNEAGTFVLYAKPEADQENPSPVGITLGETVVYVHTGTNSEGDKVTMILLPQELDGVTFSFDYTMDGIPQSTSKEVTGTWLPGTKYNYTATFGANEITFVPSVNGWDVDDTLPGVSIQ